MEAITTHTGTAVPLRRSNVDTDQIIPAVYLKRVTRTGFADGLFSAWRNDPSFVLNDPAHEGATILIPGPDFGTGSSREHAVWALMDHGFRVVIGSRFGDIFRNNSGKAGLVIAVIDESDVHKLQELVAGDPSLEITVDLEHRTITVAGWTIDFEIDDYTRWRLMEGLDDVALTLRNESDITAYEGRRLPFKPSTLPAASGS
ncbi:3-isopropylmalate/(R)-2-methylmalate dehydratase small subunit [Naumannella cuiyingiana]|uniref:3-isopropylmalate dehydratase small subunit n=1 Tax=Naumannella cuiyingiana TaxID=1347891 RepID=A0A7Z0DBX2_9ACTN|nr:3-isopropylmalate dehydratase small subunit [Naumannella cuiyingiana]NYI72480.1 3-isopropylmalate/(R)-2-methylmalate dehydratase small subunit [Naumannella cuiyingiana]